MAQKTLQDVVHEQILEGKTGAAKRRFSREAPVSLSSHWCPGCRGGVCRGTYTRADLSALCPAPRGGPVAPNRSARACVGPPPRRAAHSGASPETRRGPWDG